MNVSRLWIVYGDRLLRALQLVDATRRKLEIIPRGRYSVDDTHTPLIYEIQDPGGGLILTHWFPEPFCSKCDDVAFTDSDIIIKSQSCHHALACRLHSSINEHSCRVDDMEEIKSAIMKLLRCNHNVNCS